MKNLFASLFSIFCVTLLSAQSIDFTKDGRHYYIVSPNGRFFTGTMMDGPGCFFDAESKTHFLTDSAAVSIMGVNDEGEAYGSYLGFASIWHQGQEWEQLPGRDGAPNIRGGICGMSRDRSRLVVDAVVRSVPHEPDVYAVLVYTRNEKGDWDIVEIPFPDKDELYKMAPQFIRIGGMNYEGNRIIGEYLLADGKRVVPIVWEQDPEHVGDSVDGWSYRFLLTRTLLRKDASVEDMLPRSDFDNVMEYDAFRSGMESGILIGLPSFSVHANCGRCKYIPCQVSVFNEDEMFFDSYAGAIDIDKDSLLILNSVCNATTASINDNDEVMICSPGMDYFRRSYVADLFHPEQAVSLTDYTKARSYGKIDLADYMMYKRDQIGPLVLAEGSATWAADGNAFVTFNYDEWNENLVPHCYFVRFDAGVDYAVVDDDSFYVFPNPSNGLIHFSDVCDGVTLFDMSGRMVWCGSDVGSSVDLSFLDAGTYFLSVNRKFNRSLSEIVIYK